jgi:hypothetical protein
MEDTDFDESSSLDSKSLQNINSLSFLCFELEVLKSKSAYLESIISFSS